MIDSINIVSFSFSKMETHKQKRRSVPNTQYKKAIFHSYHIAVELIGKKFTLPLNSNLILTRTLERCASTKVKSNQAIIISCLFFFFLYF